MWTKTHRQRLAELKKQTRGYPSDLTDAEWLAIKPLLPQTGKTGRKRRTDLREVLNAIRYTARRAAGWRMLPKDFPPWQTVYWGVRGFVRRLLFHTIHDIAVMLDRGRDGRGAPSPRAACSTVSRRRPRGPRSAGTTRAKRSSAANATSRWTQRGYLLMVNLTPADLSDGAGAQMILDAIRKYWPWLRARLETQRRRAGEGFFVPGRRFRRGDAGTSAQETDASGAEKPHGTNPSGFSNGF